MAKKIKAWVQFHNESGETTRTKKNIDIYPISDAEIGVLDGYALEVPLNLKLKKGEHCQIIIKKE